MKRHAFEKISLLALLAVSLLVLAGFLPIPLPMFRGLAEDTIRGAGADSVSVGGVTVVPWRGVTARDVRAHKRINPREEYYIDIDRIEIDCNLIGAALESMRDPSLLKPDRDLFREIYEKPLAFVGGVNDLALSFAPLKKVTLRGASARFLKREKRGREEVTVDGVSIRGADITLRKADFCVFGRGKGRGIFAIVFVKQAAVPPLAVVEDFNLTLPMGESSMYGGPSTKSEGRVGPRLDIVGSGKMFGGKIDVNVSLDVDSSRILGGGLHVKGMDLEKFCARTKFAPGRMSGIVNLDAAAEPESPIALDSIRAYGKASVTQLAVDDLALQRTPAVRQLSKSLSSLRFTNVNSNFNLSEGKVKFDSITAAGDVLSFNSIGWIDFEGKLYQNFQGEFSPSFTAALPRVVRNSLERTPDGGGRFKCKISGSFHRPKIEVDRSVYNRAFKNLFK